MFFIWTDGQEKLKVLSEDLNRFHPNLKFTSEKDLAFLDLKVKVKQGKTETDMYLNLRADTYTFIILPHTLSTLSNL